MSENHTDPQQVPARAPYDHERAEAAVRELLLAVGEDPDREGLRETPARVARAYREVFAGLHEDPTEVLHKTFAEDHQELVLVRDIPIYSTCEHHLVPFYGVAHIGYIPGKDGHVTGLSKLARLADLYAKRPQDNWALLQALPEFLDGEFPILVGASRKRFLAAIRADRGVEASPLLADPATAAVTAISAQMGAWGVRVHEVAVSRDAVDVAAAWNAGDGYKGGANASGSYSNGADGNGTMKSTALPRNPEE